MTKPQDSLSDELLEKLERSVICQLLYQSYLKMGDSGNFAEYANECWRCYAQK